MPFPKKIPECSNHKLDARACPKSDVIAAEEHPKHIVFFCRTCKGVQIYTRDERPRAPRPAPFSPYRSF